MLEEGGNRQKVNKKSLGSKRENVIEFREAKDGSAKIKSEMEEGDQGG